LITTLRTEASWQNTINQLLERNIIMSLHIGAVTFDCADATKVAQFWSTVLNHPVDEGGNEFFTSIGVSEDTCLSPALFFIQVPEAKQMKNRVHLDLNSDNWKAEVDRVVALGAIHVSDFNEHGHQWSALRDPFGNEFDIGADDH
jgi:uncharacterized glyoxalase superfamily protein PhnB